MTALQLFAATATPTLVILGVLYAALRRMHRYAHHWQKIWGLPDVVDTLSRAVTGMTAAADHATDEIRQLKELVHERLEPQRGHDGRGGSPWRTGGR